MIEQTHMNDLADTPPAPRFSHEGERSVNPLPEVDQDSLRFLRSLYWRTFGAELRNFDISEDGTYLYTEDNEDGVKVLLEIKDASQALFFKELMDFVSHLTTTKVEYT